MAMGLFSKMKDKFHFNMVRGRLAKLIQDAVITENELSFQMVYYEGELVPQIIATMSRLAQQGHFTGLEASVERFCEVLGMAQGAERIANEWELTKK
jgi:hypothetical protein